MQTIFISRIACLLLISFSSTCLLAGVERKATVAQDYPIIAPTEAVEHVPVKNVIYMIGDGMGFSHIYTAWVANKGKLNLDHFPVVGVSRTWCTNKLITDSAAAGTALACGEKTSYGTVGMTPTGEKLDSLIVHAKNMGKATGVVVTCDLTDATPASFFSHVPRRNKVFDIASLLPSSRLDFLVAGGLSKLEQRPDGRKILDEMKQLGYSVVLEKSQLNDVCGGKVCAILAPEHLPAPKERGDVLEKAVKKGLGLLSHSKNGFFLMVEGSKIDKAAHKNDLSLMLEEIFDFDRTIGIVLQWAASHPGTLVVVTADHTTGGLTLLGGDKKKGEVICHFASVNHNEIVVPVFAFGAGANEFTGVYENTDIFKKILQAMKKGAEFSQEKREPCHPKQEQEVGLEK